MRFFRFSVATATIRRVRETHHPPLWAIHDSPLSCADNPFCPFCREYQGRQECLPHRWLGMRVGRGSLSEVSTQPSLLAQLLQSEKSLSSISIYPILVDNTLVQAEEFVEMRALREQTCGSAGYIEVLVIE